MRFAFKQFLPVVVMSVSAAGCGDPEASGDDVGSLEGGVTVDTNATYTIVGLQSDKCVEVAGGSTAKSASLQIAACNATTRQQFRMESMGGGFFRFKNVNSGLCVDVTGGSMADGAKIIQWTCKDGTNQQWSFTDVATGVERLTARHSGKVMAVKGQGTADGTLLEQGTSNNGESQKFMLQKLSAALTPLAPLPCTDYATLPAGDYEGPIVVTSANFGNKGKTAADPIVISGRKFRDDRVDRTPDDKEPVTIMIGEPNLHIVIENNIIASTRGYMISGGAFTDLTVRNNYFYGMKPGKDDVPTARVMDFGKPRRAIIEHNYMDHTRGMKIVAAQPLVDGGTATDLKIRYNRVNQLDGRWRNPNQPPFHSESKFIQLFNISGIGGIEVAWNEISNCPNLSMGGDHISLYSASGTAADPIDVHDNLLYGAYPYPATHNKYYGSCITTDTPWRNHLSAADKAKYAPLVPSYAEVHHNVAMNCGNGALNLVTGNNQDWHDNRVVNSHLSRTPDVTYTMWMSPGGLYNWANLPTSGSGKLFYDNRWSNNEVVWWRPITLQANAVGGEVTGNTVESTTATLDTEMDEYEAFLQRAADAGIQLGPLL